MDSEDDTSLSISKWPFYVGDVLLVATALSIAVLGEWDLSSGEIFACVLSVALGAGLFVLPYLYEYTMRLKEDSDDVEASLRSLAKQIERTQSRLSDLEAQGVQKKDVLNPVQLAEALVPIETRLGSLETKDEMDGKDLKRLASLVVQLEKLEERVVSIETTPGQMAPISEPPERSARKRPSKKSNLLQRAIQEKQEPDLPAVSRIIEAVPNDMEKIEASVVEENPSAAATKNIPESKPEPESIEPTEALRAAIPIKEPDSKEETDVSPELAESKAETVIEPIPTGDLFGQGEGSPRPKPRKRVKKTDTVLTVSALIGIGNKPYLRGSGGGLTWDSGQQLDFLSIGKWGWTAPETLEEPIEVQVYSNDREPDQSGKHTLRPCEKLQINARF